MFQKLKISKRQKFVLTAVFLSLGLFIIHSFGQQRYEAIGGLVASTLVLSIWSLSEGLTGINWFTVLILPPFFTAGVGLFYFLIPPVWWIRLPAIFLYGLGLYVLMLTENIFSVAAIRTIQLLRAAQAVGFLLTVVTAFFLYDTILSFRLDPWFNCLLVGLISLPLLIQGLWCINLEERITRRILFYSLAIALVLGEMALILSFWPLTVAVGSLGLTTVLYLLLGLVQHRLGERLFRRTINEYMGVGIVVLIVLILSAHWGG